MIPSVMYILPTLQQNIFYCRYDQEVVIGSAHWNQQRLCVESRVLTCLLGQ